MTEYGTGMYCFNEAAGIPAEDLRSAVPPMGRRAASMRPRVFPRKTREFGSLPSPSESSFNEASGIPRGRLGIRRHNGKNGTASMRPRVFPAEDSAHEVVEPSPVASLQ